MSENGQIFASSKVYTRDRRKRNPLGDILGERKVATKDAFSVAFSDMKMLINGCL